MNALVQIFGEEQEDALPPEFESMPADSIASRVRLLDNEIR